MFSVCTLTASGLFHARITRLKKEIFAFVDTGYDAGTIYTCDRKCFYCDY